MYRPTVSRPRKPRSPAIRSSVTSALLSSGLGLASMVLVTSLLVYHSVVSLHNIIFLYVLQSAPTSVTTVAVCLPLQFLRHASRDDDTVFLVGYRGLHAHCGNVQLRYLPWVLVSRSAVDLVMVLQKCSCLHHCVDPSSVSKRSACRGRCSECIVVCTTAESSRHAAAGNNVGQLARDGGRAPSRIRTMTGTRSITEYGRRPGLAPVRVRPAVARARSHSQ